MHTEIIFQVTWRYDHEYMKQIRSDDKTKVCQQDQNILQGKKEESSSEVAISFSSDDEQHGGQQIQAKIGVGALPARSISNQLSVCLSGWTQTITHSLNNIVTCVCMGYLFAQQK